MRSCHYYWLIEPVREQIDDPNETKTGFDIDIPSACGRVLKFSFLQYLDGQPFGVRIQIPDLEMESIPSQCAEAVQAAKEHFMSIYRLNYDLEGSYFGRSIYLFLGVNEGPKFAIKKSEISSTPNTQILHSVFAASYAQRVECKLITDSQDRRIPIQFRFLSAFALIEKRFRPNGEWDYGAVDSLLSNYETAFRALGYEKKPFKTLMSIRDRCAHITPRGDTQGVTSLNNKDANEVESVMGVLVRIGQALINEEANGCWELRSRDGTDAQQHLVNKK